MVEIDYYAEARQVIEALSALGLVSEADGLRDAISAGATGTEILMGIRWHLKQILRGKKCADGATLKRMKKLVSDLNKAL